MKMFTNDTKFKNKIEDIVDNKIVSSALLRELNQQEREIRRFFIDLIIVYVLGKENKLLFSIIYFLFRKELHEILDDTKRITKEAILNFVNKLKAWKSSHNQ